MRGSFFANPKSIVGSWRTMTLTEALLAVFTVGLLLGLWLGGVTGKREMRELKMLEQRIESLELQRTLLETPFFSRPGHAPQGSSPETDTDLDQESIPLIRV